MRPNDAINTEQVNGYTVSTYLDDFAGLDYSDGDHLGHITYRKSSHYCLGDTPMDSDELHRALNVDHEEDDEWNRLNDAYQEADYNTEERVALLYQRDAREATLEGVLRDDVIVMPVYAYVHSGATIRVGQPFSCPWDSAQSGVVYCTDDEAKDWFRVRPSHWDAELKRTVCDAPRDTSPLTADERERAIAVLTSEVEEFDHYLRGDIYGFVVTNDCGESVDSCWGFVGDEKYCMEAGVSSARSLPTMAGTPLQFRDLASRIADEQLGGPGRVRLTSTSDVERVTGNPRAAWVQAWIYCELDDPDATAKEAA